MKLLFALATLFLSTAISRAESRDHDSIMAALAGTKLTTEQAADLEISLAEHPDDLATRTKLLGYYAASRHTSADAKEARRKHVFWIIKNHPDASVAGTPYCMIYDTSDPAGYRDAKQLWSEQTKAHAKYVAVLGNAAQFLLLRDRAEAEDLLKQARSLEPKNAKWSDQLAHLYAMEGGKSGAKKALAEYERAQSVDDTEISKFNRLEKLARAAFDAGEYEKAAHYADESLKTAANTKPDWNSGNAINHANNTLGRIALKNGDTKKADEYLLKAGETPGSPQLNSFGPNMSLAQELLKAGEKDTVLQYFALCRKFWKMGGDRLDEWTKQVKAGQFPQFGANLYY
jgi:tetratricopeptide (TPR) repeat protein